MYGAAGVAVAVVAGVLLGGQGFAGAALNTAPDRTTGPSPAAAAARAQPLVPGTPCSTAAKACVDLDSQRAWLIKEGKVMRGPVNIASGGKTEPTPVAHDVHVYLKDATHVSNESFTDGKPDPMPLSVFFMDGGIAFHEGDPENASGGCIHLAHDDAQAWFDYLQMGDDVQVVNASVEYAARGMTYDGKKYGFGGVRAWEKEHGDS
jgi:lipoprotein-anchoring transpeptidase ErfK/SrfK